MFTDKIKSWGFRILWLALCVSMVYGGYKLIETKNSRIDTLQTEVKTVKTERDALQDVIVKKVESDDKTEVVVAETKKDETKHEIAKTKAAVYVDTKLKEIEAKYADQEQTEANRQRKAMEISLERAKGMWLTYCLQEPTEKACK